VEEYEFKNATTLRLKIHEGVTFHDGTTLDATDCVDTLLRQIQNVNEIDKMKYFLNILEVHYEAPYQFEIVLEEPDPYLLRYLTFGITKALNPNERTEKDAPKQFHMRDPGLKTFYGDVTDIWDIKYTNNYDTFIGSGPYVFSEEKKAVGAYKTLIAYNNYWRGEPEVKEI
jgi:ABC-type transport system substrate-binding protein